MEERKGDEKECANGPEFPTPKRIMSKKDLKEWMASEKLNFKFRDLFLLTERDIIKRFKRLLRKTEYYINTGKKIRAIIYKIRLYRLQNRYGLHIPPNVCGKGLSIVHVGSILINGRCVVGENCSFHINTALVASGSEVPRLGNGVLMGIGSVCVGGVYVADNVIIGANAVVTKDVLESDVAVAGVPAKKVSDIGRSRFKKRKNG